jgi:hypothetical protein
MVASSRNADEHAGNERVELQQFKRPPPTLLPQAALKKQKQISAWPLAQKAQPMGYTP